MNTPLHTPVRREALRAAVEAHRRLLEAEEQVRAAEEDWNFARAQFGSAAAEEYGRRLEAAKAASARSFDTYSTLLILTPSDASPQQSRRPLTKTPCERAQPLRRPPHSSTEHLRHQGDDRGG